MTIPRPDPLFTFSDLREAAQKFSDAGQEYWDATHRAGFNLGAVIWNDYTRALMRAALEAAEHRT